MIENKLCERYNKIIESALENVDCEEGGDTLKKIKLGAVLMAALMMLSLLLTACSGGASSAATSNAGFSINSLLHIDAKTLN